MIPLSISEINLRPKTRNRFKTKYRIMAPNLSERLKYHWRDLNIPVVLNTGKDGTALTIRDENLSNDNQRLSQRRKEDIQDEKQVAKRAEQRA